MGSSKLRSYVRMAVKTIGRARVRSALSMSGVAVGVFAVMMLVAVGEAARLYVLKQFEGMGADVIHVMPGKSETRGLPLQGGASRPITNDDVEFVKRRMPAGMAVGGQLQGNGNVKFENRTRGVYAFGVDDNYDDMKGLDLLQGRFFDADEVKHKASVIVLGKKVKDELLRNEPAIGAHVSMYNARFRVIGVLAPKGTGVGVDLDDAVYIPRTTAAELLNAEGVSALLVHVPRERIDEAAAKVEELLASRHKGVDFTILRPDDLLDVVNKVIGALNALLVSIGSIALFVGGLGIANVMLMSVRERTREIGIRRAVGARRADILVQFLCESAVVSVFGGLVGAAAGLLVSAIAVFGYDVPISISPWFVVLVLVFSATVGVLAGLFPARRASAISPLEALRSA